MFNTDRLTNSFINFLTLGLVLLQQHGTEASKGKGGSGSYGGGGGGHTEPPEIYVAAPYSHQVMVYSPPPPPRLLAVPSYHSSDSYGGGFYNEGPIDGGSYGSAHRGNAVGGGSYDGGQTGQGRGTIGGSFNGAAPHPQSVEAMTKVINHLVMEKRLQ